MVKTFICLLLSAVLVWSKPTISPPTSTTYKSSTQQSALIASNSKITPELQPTGQPDLTEFVEVKEEDIPDGTWVLEVEESLVPQKEKGEILETANNIVFRPLFRYREKQGNRRISQANRRVRRRYYVPRRSYRHASYYRPYRSASYYPSRYYGYYG